MNSTLGSKTSVTTTCTTWCFCGSSRSKSCPARKEIRRPALATTVDKFADCRCDKNSMLTVIQWPVARLSGIQHLHPRRGDHELSGGCPSSTIHWASQDLIDEQASGGRCVALCFQATTRQLDEMRRCGRQRLDQAMKRSCGTLSSWRIPTTHYWTSQDASLSAEIPC